VCRTDCKSCPRAHAKPSDQAGKEGCQPWTKKAVAEATRGFASCLTLAFDLFDEVLISPHLDDGTRTSHW
jgi:hypothetical protein